MEAQAWENMVGRAKGAGGGVRTVHLVVFLPSSNHGELVALSQGEQHALQGSGGPVLSQRRWHLGQALTAHPGSLLGANTTQDKFTCDSPPRESLLASVSTITGTKEWAVYPRPHPHPPNYAVYLHGQAAPPWGAQAAFAGGRGKAWLEIPLLFTPLC